MFQFGGAIRYVVNRDEGEEAVRLILNRGEDPFHIIATLLMLPDPVRGLNQGVKSRG